MNTRIILLCIALCSAMLACNDESADPTPSGPLESDTHKLLITGEWKRVGYEKNGIDMWFLYPDCVRDDKYGYRKNGTAYFDESVDVCDTAYKHIEWTWELINDDRQLKEMYDSSRIYIRDIVLLTETQLQYVSYFNNDTLMWYYQK